MIGAWYRDEEEFMMVLSIRYQWALFVLTLFSVIAFGQIEEPERQTPYDQRVYQIHESAKMIEGELRNGMVDGVSFIDGRLSIDLSIFPGYEQHLKTWEDVPRSTQYIFDQVFVDNGFLVVDNVFAKEDVTASNSLGLIQDMLLFGLALDEYKRRNGADSEALDSCGNLCMLWYMGCKARVLVFHGTCVKACQLSVPCVQLCATNKQGELLGCELDYISCYFFSCGDAPED